MNEACAGGTGAFIDQMASLLDTDAAGLNRLAIRWFEHLRGALARALADTPVGNVPPLREQLERIDGLVDAGQQAGEGWLLTAEMVDFIRSGMPNVVCLQPFGCLPNHVTGKGVMRRLREENPLANLCAVDFEEGTSKANVTNRLKLFLAQARENFAAAEAAPFRPGLSAPALTAQPGPEANHRVIPIMPAGRAQAAGASETGRRSADAGGRAVCSAPRRSEL